MSQNLRHLISPFQPQIPNNNQHLLWGNCRHAVLALAMSQLKVKQPILLVAEDINQALHLQAELQFFCDNTDILIFPDWETLPYDIFSPLPELVSQRLLAMYQLQSFKQGILIVPVATLMQRLPPVAYINANTFYIKQGSLLDLAQTRLDLEASGYLNVTQVMNHGEYALRGSIFDIFPMGSEFPFRIELFDDEVESIRTFAPDSQQSIEKVSEISLLPAREFPLDKDVINQFKAAFVEQFEGDPKRSLIYNELAEDNVPGGLEYYLPLFFKETATLFDYLPKQILTFFPDTGRAKAVEFWQQVEERFKQHTVDTQRPPLLPKILYLEVESLVHQIKQSTGIRYASTPFKTKLKGFSDFINFQHQDLNQVSFEARKAEPTQRLQQYLADFKGSCLFIAESAGRREALLEHLAEAEIKPVLIEDWGQFIKQKPTLGITIAPLERSIQLLDPKITLITESQLLGERVKQARGPRKSPIDSSQIFRNLTELSIGSPVVHEDHGIGRFLGLQYLTIGGQENEFLALEYKKGDKLYVPVASLHLISRYSGSNPDTAPLHSLDGKQWEKVKAKALKRIQDVAAELLEIYARRAAAVGYGFSAPDQEYSQFSAEFEFEETPDQKKTIEAVINDMTQAKPMDRVVCGDVGFGKTEVAMRATFMAIQDSKQVVIIAPTTLLAQQHFNNFADRFANWPVKVAGLSRFNSGKQAKNTIAELEAGTVDIVIGTHKLILSQINYKRLGLVIIDEEHRFGVKHKEQLKAIRAQVDLLTLTATPIPRTLNMAMAGMRDLSIIATPPPSRHPITTFVSQWDDIIISEACQRELKRGGQLYFLHNEVSTIANIVEKLQTLIPQARIEAAHGQMREKELEAIMRDFYHQRFHILVSTTIIESGIDVPSANTIIINRADKLGLAQLHQLRGRVGRSHHRAYAYLLTPPPKQMTSDAKKRLQAIESLQELGAGFSLASHDLEIRGAGELLGKEQSGQVHEIGFSLYAELLERAVQALKAGKQPQLDRPLDHGTVVDLQMPAILPEDYIGDVQQRLTLYKRIASATSKAGLRSLKIELIDRFGLLPDYTQNLFATTEIKLIAHPLGINKVECGEQGGRLVFSKEVKIDPLKLIQLIQTQSNRFKLKGQEILYFTDDYSSTENRAEKIKQLLLNLK